MPYAHTIGLRRYQFHDLKTLLAVASPARSGNRLAGVMAATAQERVQARIWPTQFVSPVMKMTWKPSSNASTW